MKDKLSAGDWVRLPKSGSKQPQYGYLGRYDRETGYWTVIGDGTVTEISEERLELMPPYRITPEIAKGLLRYELTYADYAAAAEPVGNWVCGQAYSYTLADMEALLKNLQKKKPGDAELADWARLVTEELSGQALVSDGRAEYCTGHDFPGMPLPGNDTAMAECLFEELAGFLPENYAPGGHPDVDIKQMLADIRAYRANKGIHRALWSYSKKSEALGCADDSFIRAAAESELEDLRSIVTQLSAAGDTRALEVLAYACYGGSRLFACDWERSRDCLLRLSEREDVPDRDKAFYANTLGYIYYYGRCSGGVPEYDRAFSCFSLGAACGVYESMYKLADMYLHGYGTAKNLYAAQILLRMVFDRSYDSIRGGEFDCEFADVALRLGNLCRDGIIEDESAGAYYLMADFAIKKRAKFNRYGDSKVACAIAGELARIRGEEPVKRRTTLHGDDALDIVSRLFNDYTCEVTIKPVKQGISFRVKRMPHPHCDEAAGEFDLLPEYGYCDIASSATFTAAGAELPQLREPVTFIADSFSIAEVGGKSYCLFMHHREPVFAVEANDFTRRLPAAHKKHEKRSFASVVFNDGGKSYDYLCSLSDVGAGDRVVVEANDGEAEVTVVRVFEADICDMPLDPVCYKKVLRKV